MHFSVQEFFFFWQFFLCSPPWLNTLQCPCSLELLPKRFFNHLPMSWQLALYRKGWSNDTNECWDYGWMDGTKRGGGKNKNLQVRKQWKSTNLVMLQRGNQQVLTLNWQKHQYFLAPPLAASVYHRGLLFGCKWQTVNAFNNGKRNDP